MKSVEELVLKHKNYISYRNILATIRECPPFILFIFFYHYSANIPMEGTKSDSHSHPESSI